MKFLSFKYNLLILFYLLSISVRAQHKQIEAVKTNEPIMIDGILDEAVWQNGFVATDFVQYEPYNGKPASHETEVRILYSDLGIYIGAQMLDVTDSISLELGSRDEDGLADFFGFVVDPFCDGLNGFGFAVTARGVQIDFKIDANDDLDDSWDAVWKSSAKVNEKGWAAEMMIPYSAIRFVKKDVQSWRINFWRSVQRYREYSTWNPIDIKVKGELSQSGELTQLIDLKPPLRLSATPYVSATGNYYTGNNQFSLDYNYGLDLKAGLSESFTLDLTLIPDFGQVESDETIYSLSPFEVYYEEKRPFFTEGTELFSKGEVFYSRRVGARPGKYWEVENNIPDEEIIENPESAQLINAVKLSGKTNSGLGIGVFNAMNANTYAIIQDSNGIEQKIQTEPFTNFNMFVLDQAFKNNSFLSFYNTNVYKPESNYVANVTGTEFRLRDEKNMYEIDGLLNISQHYTKENASLYGKRSTLKLAKISGTIRAETWVDVIGKNYDPNDLGFQPITNILQNGFQVSHNIYEPRGRILKWNTILNISQSYRIEPMKFTNLSVNLNSIGTFRNQLTIGAETQCNPLGYYDFYEPRVEGSYYYDYPSYSMTFFTSPDYAKTFIIDDHVGFSHSPYRGQFSYWFGIEPRWRISNSFLIIPSITFNFQNNNFGYVMDSLNNQTQMQDIIFGRRDLETITSSLSVNYIFTKDISLKFNLRHYWLRVDYLSFYDLQTDGSLIENTYNKPEDFSVNLFNIDMVFQWNFAPGSELLVIWKNALYEKDHGYPNDINYIENINQMFESPFNNSLSIKAIFYLDWQYFQKKKNK